MQYLRDGGWIKAKTLPPAVRLIEGLLTKGWIEQQTQAQEIFYRITPEGLAAKVAPLPISR